MLCGSVPQIHNLIQRAGNLHLSRWPWTWLLMYGFVLHVSSNEHCNLCWCQFCGLRYLRTQPATHKLNCRLADIDVWKNLVLKCRLNIFIYFYVQLTLRIYLTWEYEARPQNLMSEGPRYKIVRSVWNFFYSRFRLKAVYLRLQPIIIFREMACVVFNDVTRQYKSVRWKPKKTEHGCEIWLGVLVMWFYDAISAAPSTDGGKNASWRVRIFAIHSSRCCFCK